MRPLPLPARVEYWRRQLRDDLERAQGTRIKHRAPTTTERVEALEAAVPWLVAQLALFLATAEAAEQQR